MSIELEFSRRTERDAELTATVWRPGAGWRGISSALLGGGIGPIGWVVNAQVPGGYDRMDPDVHLEEIAAAHGLTGRGVGMLTAASVDRTFTRDDAGVEVAATVGLRVPTWAAAPADRLDPELAPMHLPDPPRSDPPLPTPPRPGTINITVAVPVALTDAALVNAVITATEAKTQAMLEAGYPGTGTASDAIVVVSPEVGEPEQFAGPRAVWGARIARAVHAVVLAGAEDYGVRLARRKSGP